MSKSKYCIFCGTENDIHNEKCCNKKCKKKFVDDYYDLLYLVVDYYKGDFDGKFFDLLKAILVYLLNTWTYGIVVVFSIVAAATNVIAVFNEPENNITTASPISHLSSELLPNDEDVLNELYRSYVSNIGIGNGDSNYPLLNGNSIKINDLDNIYKLKVALGNLEFPHVNYGYISEDSTWMEYPEASKYYNELIEYRIEKHEEGIIYDPNVYSSYFILKQDDLINSYKEIFGNDNYKLESFYYNSDYYCEYVVGKDFYCYFGSGSDSLFSLVDLIESRTYKNRIEMDVVSMACTSTECYTDYSKKTHIAAIRDSEDGEPGFTYYDGKLKGLKYTFTFLKKENGNYEWYNIENKGEYYE